MRENTALRLSLVYAAVATIWIILSDQLTLVFSAPAELGSNFRRLSLIQTSKGLLFVVATSVALYAILKQAFSERDHLEETLERRGWQLGERVKELRALHTISSLLNQQAVDDVAACHQILETLPPAWQYPAITAARLEIGHEVYKTARFQETPWILHQEIRADGEQLGAIEVCYLEERPEAQSGPFLAEEVALLKSVADEIGVAISRVHAENALRASEARFRRLAENVPDIIYRYRFIPEPEVEYVSPAVRDIMGYAPQAFYSNPALLLDVVSPVDQPLMEELMAGERATEPVTVKVAKGDGSPVWLERRGSLVHDEQGKPVAIEGVIRDVTRQKQAEQLQERYQQELEVLVKERTQELARTKERVESILNSSPDAITLLGEDGSIRAANPAFHEMFGHHIDDVYGQAVGVLVRSEHVEVMRVAFERVISAREMMRIEIEAQSATESTFETDVALAPIVQDHELIGVVCSFRDITAFKEVERLKDAFVSNVSHELRSPIVAIKINQELMRLAPDNRELYLSRMYREVDRLERLIEDLLLLSQLQQSGRPLELRPTDLNLIAARLVGDRTPIAGTRDLSLELDLQPRLPPVKADESLLEQVLSILLTNALNYTPAGGRVEVSTWQRSDKGVTWAGLAVSDTGPGIPPAEQTRLFERFFRGESGVKSEKPGTGLGLAIAKQIVDQQGGRIEVESEGVPGEGATFEVWLRSGPRSS